MATVAPPARTEISDTYPNPSDAVARVGFGKLWDYVTNLLGVTGSPATARTALAAAASGANADITSLSAPALGAATATTATAGDNTTKVATTAFAQGVSAKIQPVTASVASNALTCTLNPTVLDFRSPTLSAGTVNNRSVGSAISVVTPSTATLGTVSTKISRIILVAIDTTALGGGVELAVVNISGGNNLDETGVISTTAISAGATSANVFYSTTARAGVPYRVVGYVESTQTVAGTWATAPSTIQGSGGGALSSMASIGYGQTLGANLYAGTRNYATTYYNTGGKPITVLFGTSNSSALTFTIAIGSGSFVPPPTGVASAFNISFIVPPGASYSISVAGGTPTTNVWQEIS